MGDEFPVLSFFPPGPVVFVPNTVLKEGGAEHHTFKGQIRLENISNDPVVFKIKTTNASRYLVRPHVGLLEPRESRSVSFTVPPSMIDAFLQDYSDSLPPKGRPCTAFLMIWWTVPDEVAAEMRHLAKADAQALPASINTRFKDAEARRSSYESRAREVERQLAAPDCNGPLRQKLSNTLSELRAALDATGAISQKKFAFDIDQSLGVGEGGGGEGGGEGEAPKDDPTPGGAGAPERDTAAGGSGGGDDAAAYTAAGPFASKQAASSDPSALPSQWAADVPSSDPAGSDPTPAALSLARPAASASPLLSEAKEEKRAGRSPATQPSLPADTAAAAEPSLESESIAAAPAAAAAGRGVGSRVKASPLSFEAPLPRVVEDPHPSAQGAGASAEEEVKEAEVRKEAGGSARKAVASAVPAAEAAESAATAAEKASAASVGRGGRSSQPPLPPSAAAPARSTPVQAPAATLRPSPSSSASSGVSGGSGGSSGSGGVNITYDDAIQLRAQLDNLMREQVAAGSMRDGLVKENGNMKRALELRNKELEDLRSKLAGGGETPLGGASPALRQRRAGGAADLASAAVDDDEEGLPPHEGFQLWHVMLALILGVLLGRVMAQFM